MTNQRLYAFWKYDSFPYVLSSEVDRFVEEGAYTGYVKVKGYGGAMFKPVKILPLKAGQELAKKLDLLKAQYHAKLDETHEVFSKKLKEVFDVNVP